MQNTKQFQQNAGVFTADGREVGRIDRVVVDPQSKVVTHVVIRKGFLLTQDRVVPIALVAGATEDQVRLREDAGDLNALPPFEEKHYILAADDGGAPGSPAGMAPSVYGSLPLGTLSDHGAAPGPRHVAQVEQNIPEGTVALKEGARVVSAEGKNVGHVERVFTDAEANRATHLLISHGLLLKERKLIPIAWVHRVGEEEVHLAVDQKVLERLSTYHN